MNLSLGFGLDKYRVQDGTLLNQTYDPTKDNELTMMLSRSGSLMVDSIGDNDAAILTPVLNITTANTVSVSDSTSFRKATQSFIIEWYGNIIDVVNYWVRCGEGTTAIPGYMLSAAQLRLGNAAGQFCNQNHGLGYDGGGWMHCMIVVDRAGFVDAYKNGVGTMHYDISASSAQSLDNTAPFSLASQTGASGTQAHLSYFRMYEFPGAVPALDFAALALSNYQTRDIHISLLPYCTHDYNFCRNVFYEGVHRFYNQITDNDVSLAVSNTQTSTEKYSEHGSLYNLNYGYSIFRREPDQKAKHLTKTLPLMRNGATRTTSYSTDIYPTSVTSKNATSGYWLRDVAGSETSINLADCKIRFAQDFFDRSNATIWKDAARYITVCRITLTGTSGTADISVNGVTKTATFATSLAITVANFVEANYLAYRAVGISLRYEFSILIFEAYDRNGITSPSINNTGLTLNGVLVTGGGYDSTDTKAFHVNELTQRTLMEWLNDDYKSMLYVKGKSTYYGSQYNGTVEHDQRDSIDEIFLSDVDKTLIAHLKILQYTGDSFAKVTDANNNVDYDAADHVQLGYFKSTKPQFAVRLDDSLIAQYTLWLPWFTSRGWTKVTLSANTGYIEDGESGEVMSYAQVKECQDAGWEIGNHTDAIANSQYYTPENSRNNIIEAKTKLMAAGIAEKGLDIITIHNYGGLNLYTRFWVLRNYRANWYLKVPRTEEFTEAEIVDLGLLNSMITDAASTVYDLSTDDGLNLLKAQIDIAAANNRICSWFCHAYSAAIEERMEDAIEYAIAQGLEMVTYSEALDNCKYLPLD